MVFHVERMKIELYSFMKWNYSFIFYEIEKYDHRTLDAFSH
jgi:hypothetical protein